jgi:DNA invertase Pin-like site-specific DNA recombinase
MMAKISAEHIRRRAVVYLRQSTLKQVLENTESTRRQYDLRERALALGWTADSIEVIDEDLGRSGSTTEGRTGFRKLSEEIAHGNVGGVFALDVSRLARSSADWHRLLDLCGVADVLIADDQAVYDPRDHNDRLMLGIKGTMSEAELGWMRLRLRGARISKARRGDHYLAPPIGYDWDGATQRLRLDPDAEVQRALRLIFERFRIERSAYAVARYFIEQGLKVPARRLGSRELSWSAPRPSRILQILTNPTYAGTYVYGRRQHTVGLADGQIVRCNRRIPVEGWKIVHRDHHPTYLGWEQYMRNQQTLKDNRPHRDAPDRHGAPREGNALLQGIVLCGRCGCRMHGVFAGKGRRPRYWCSSPAQRGEQMRTCWSVAAGAIDRELARLLLSVVQPPEIEIGLAVTREAERQAKQLNDQWRLRLERARYEARLAERRYKAVDPDNRVVARALEHEWDDKLRALEEVERKLADSHREKKVDLDTRDRARVLALSRSLPALWSAPSTTMAERKNIVRTLIREVCITPLAQRQGGTRVDVLWQTGATSSLTISKQLPGRRTGDGAVGLISQMVHRGRPATEIAEELNARNLATASGRAWKNLDIHSFCRHHGLRWPKRMPSSTRRPEQRRDGLYSLRGVAVKLAVTENAVRYWVARGWLKAAEGGTRGRPCWFHLDDLLIHKLKELLAEHTRPSSHRSNRS